MQNHMVDAVVTTAGGVEEDIIKCLANTYVGDFTLKGTCEGGGHSGFISELGLDPGLTCHPCTLTRGLAQGWLCVLYV